MVGRYSIDFVIEGHNDRRLAIELDGDMYHGPEQFHHDQQRQRTLERVGWNFWRCWASDWNKNPEQCYNELIIELNSRGIDPIGSDYTPAKFTRFEIRKATKNFSETFNELDVICDEYNIAKG